MKSIDEEEGTGLDFRKEAVRRSVGQMAQRIVPVDQEIVEKARGVAWKVLLWAEEAMKGETPTAIADQYYVVRTFLPAIARMVGKAETTITFEESRITVERLFGEMRVDPKPAEPEPLPSPDAVAEPASGRVPYPEEVDEDELPIPSIVANTRPL